MNNIDKDKFMSQDDIRELTESKNVELGSHGLDHAPLSSFSIEDQKKQIFESKKILSEKYNYDLKSFSYPYGYFDQNTVSFVKDAGYTTAVAADNTKTQNPLLITRVDLNVISIFSL